MIALSPTTLLLGLPLLGFQPLGASVSLQTQRGAKPTTETQAEAPDPNQLVARVGRVDITQADLAGEYQRLMPWNFFHGKVPEAKKLELRIQARDALIEKALIFQDAEDRAIAVSEAAIRERFTETLKKAGEQFANLSDERYEQFLDQFRPKVRRKLLIEKNEQRFDESLKPITEDALKKRFEEVSDQLLSPELASFLMIQLDVDPSQRNALMPVAILKGKEIRAKIIAGASFEGLAKQHSDASSAAKGGALGFVTQRGFPVPELGAAAFQLKEGETSEPLDSIHGIHLLRRVENRPRRPLEFEEARPQLLAELEHVQLSGERRAWLDGVRKRYPPKILVEIES